MAYNAPRTHYYSIPGCVFRPYYKDTVIDNQPTATMGTYVTAGSGVLVAPINLPDGAIIKSIKGNFFNYGINSILYLWLYRVDQQTGAFEVIGSVSTSQNTGNVTNTSQFSDTAKLHIDNANYSYFTSMNANPWPTSAPGNVRFIGARFAYTINEAE